MSDRLILFEAITKEPDGKKIKTFYAFGPEWVGQAMYMDDLKFETEDEAVLYWYHHIFKKGNDDECDKSSDSEA